MKKWLLSLSLVGLISNTGKSVDITDLKNMAPLAFSLYLFGKIYPSLPTETKGIINASILAGATVGIGIARYEEKQRAQNRNNLHRNYLIKKYNLEKKIPHINGLQARARHQMGPIAMYKKELQDQASHLAQEVAMYDRVLNDIAQLQKYPDFRDQKKIKTDLLSLSKPSISSDCPLMNRKTLYWSDIIQTYSFSACNPISQKCTRVRLEDLINNNQGHITQEDLNGLAKHVIFNRDTKKSMLMQFIGQIQQPSLKEKPRVKVAQDEYEQKLLGDLSMEYVRQKNFKDQAHHSNKKENVYKSILTQYAVTPD